MTDFPLHTPESAADAGREALDRAAARLGFAPNLLRVLAGAPAAAHGYLDLRDRFRGSSLDPREQQVVILATSFENGCEYCVAAHSLAGGRVGLDDELVSALRSGSALPDERLEALRGFTSTLVRVRGHVTDVDIDRFLAAGFTRANVLDVILGVAMKTLSNYTNHVVGTPLDEAFESARWTAPVEVGAP